MPGEGTPDPSEVAKRTPADALRWLRMEATGGATALDKLLSEAVNRDQDRMSVASATADDYSNGNLSLKAAFLAGFVIRDAQESRQLMDMFPDTPAGLADTETEEI